MLPVPPNGYAAQAYAATVLMDYVDADSFDMPVPLPKHLIPEQVGLFVESLMESPTLVDRQISRVGTLMRFYDLRPQVGALSEMFEREVTDVDDWECEATAVSIVGDLGTAEEAERGAERFRFLTRHPSVRLARLIDLLFHMPREVNELDIVARIDRRLQELEPQIAGSDDLQIEYYHLQDLKEDRLPTVLKAKAMKHSVLEELNIKKRRQQALQCYLELERNAYVDLSMWGAMLLQRECNSSEPPELAGVCGSALDLIRSRAAKMGELSQDDQEDERGYVTRCMHALEFYGGQLTESQQGYTYSRINAEQSDVLQW